MELTLNEVSETVAELTIELGPQQVQRKFDKQFNELQKELFLPGFRKGKVPKGELRRRFGKNVEAEVAQELASEMLEKAIEEKKLRPVGEPKVSTLQIAEGMPFRMVVQIEHLPLLNISQYRGLAPLASAIEVGEAEVQKQVRQTLLQESKRSEVERPAQAGDYVEGRFRVFVDGALEGGEEKRKFEFTIGEDEIFTGSLIDRRFTGHKAGDEFRAEGQVSADYPIERMRGKSLALEVELQKVSEQELPELTEAFVQERFSKSVEAFTEEARRQVRERKEHQDREKRLESVFEKLRSQNSFVVPEVLITTEIKSEEQQWDRNGVSEADRAELRATQRERVERKVRNALLLQRVIELEKFSVSDAEMQHRFELMGVLWGKGADVMRSFYESQPRLLQNLKDDILEKKALDFLLEPSQSSLIVEV